MSKSVYEIITNKIIEKLEKGTVPWNKPFSSARNWVTQKEYRGINALLLDGGEYATFNQIKKAGGRVKKGAESEIVVFWKMIKITEEDEETGEEIEKQIPLLRYYRVFKVGEQTTGIEPKGKNKIIHNPIEEAEKIIKGFKDSPKYTFESGRAYYRPSEDVVNVPPINDFESPEEYYATFFHEIVHSTGHKNRLNRPGITTLNPFGSDGYSREELVAEIGASMLCGVAGFENEIIDNSASYIQSWLNALRNDKTLIVHASQQAQKACDYILGKKYE